MSLGVYARSAAAARVAPGAVARIPPPGLDDQDGRGGRRGGVRHPGRLPGAVRPRSALGHAGLAAARALRRGRRRRAPACRWPCTAGSGGIAGSSSSRGSWPASTRGSATSCWASSSWSATTSSKPARAPSARRRSARSPTTPQQRDFCRRGARPAPSALGLAARPSRSRSRIGLFALVPRRGRQRLGAVPRPLGEPPALHLRRARAAPGRDGRRPRRAVHVRGEAQAADRLAARPGRGPARRTSTRSSAQLDDGRYAFELPSQIDPGTLHIQDRRRMQRVRIEPTAPARADLVVADVTLPRVSRPAAAPSARTFAAARSRWSGQPGARSPRPPAASCAQRTGRRQAADAARRDGRQPRRSPIDGPRKIEFRWARRVRPGRQGAVHPVDHRPRRRGPHPHLRRPAPPEGRARHRAAQLQGPGPGRFRRQADRHRVAGDREPGRLHAGQGRAHPGRRRPRQGDARSQRHVLGEIAGHRAPADQRPACSSRITSPAARGSTRRPTPSTC